ncbi:SPASM domain-containing protein [Acetobacterium sp. KB-1]|jgi:radical SAM protein with 4Fe4S-binding SPASM domain|uniref:radical SAM protein n=1 Tax=Acetobacterium sp. KB-1 TaxID=2184575 RepID=UPI000DBEB2C4|nr:SPASM domain-containing protein [Acetobacterium sp. KB-1]AWW26905.1 radical SAM protein [Acetobacterium sp. KB-1]
MKIYVDKKYHFYELFNEKNGTLIRSNIEGTDIDAKCRSFPELIDIGIMGSCISGKTGICKNAGIDCYQNAISSCKPDMSLDGYEWIVSQCKDKVFQVALGGAGDPNKHKDFADILEVTRYNEIIPNLTTSGYLLSDEEINLIKKYCGAVAVSYYSRLERDKESNYITCEAIERLIKAGCITNIHFIISDKTIEEAIYRLENNIWSKGISAIIFILYKPVGLGVEEKTVKVDDRFKKFMNLVLNNKYPFKIGFDTCFTPALCNYEEKISFQSIDACEAARFSMYIDSELAAYPCSFDNQTGQYKVELKPASIQEAWDSEMFEKFRSNNKEKCASCDKGNICNSGCHLGLGIDLC